MSTSLQVIKLNLDGKETWRYTGYELARSANAVLLEARFNRADTPFHGILMGQGDRFVELYYNDRMYNIFEMHDRDSDALKGWYCNVSRPAQFRAGEIAYVDLALDLLVYPDGRQLVLDEEEFALLHGTLSPQEEADARAALLQLQALFRQPGGINLSSFQHGL